MANKKRPIPGTRGWRLETMREAMGLTGDQLAAELARIAGLLDLKDGGEWSQSRVSKLILGRQIMSLDDAVAIVYLAKARGLKGRDWEWIALGERRVIHEESMADPRAAISPKKGRGG